MTLKCTSFSRRSSILRLQKKWWNLPSKRIKKHIWIDCERKKMLDLWGNWLMKSEKLLRWSFNRNWKDDIRTSFTEERMTTPTEGPNTILHPIQSGQETTSNNPDKASTRGKGPSIKEIKIFNVLKVINGTIMNLKMNWIRASWDLKEIPTISQLSQKNKEVSLDQLMFRKMMKTPKVASWMRESSKISSIRACFQAKPKNIKTNNKTFRNNSNLKILLSTILKHRSLIAVFNLHPNTFQPV